MYKVPVHYKEIMDANILGVTVGTTGYRGGDSGHGCRTIFALEDLGGTDMRVAVNGEEIYDVSKVKLTFGGDAELLTFMKALDEAINVLTAQANREPPTYEECE